jgi:SSS family solute:Na+ symporter
MTGLDALILLAFVVYAVAAGLRARRRASQSLESYFLAGRRLSGWQAGLSMAATQFAADTPLLVVGLVATGGIFALWRLWSYAVAFLLLAFVLAACWRRAGVLTDAELTELRYSGRAAAVLRALKAVYLGTLFNCTVLAMVLFAAREIAEPFLTWHRWLPGALYEPVRGSVEQFGLAFARPGEGGDLWRRSTDNLLSLAAILGVTLLYATTGGLRSVVRTDVVQLVLMLTGTAAYAAVLVDSAGGLAAVQQGVEALFTAGDSSGTGAAALSFLPPPDVSLALLGVFGLQWLVQVNADGTGYLAQRSMACRSDREARLAGVVFTLTQILLRSLLWLPIALALLVLLPPQPGEDAAAREASFVGGMQLFLPPGLAGLMLTAMLAALASTVDSHLNWGASYWANDLYRRFLCEGWLKRTPSARSQVWVARLSNVLILLLALAIMTRLDSIQRAWQLSLLMGAGIGPMLVLRWLWWRINAWSEIAAVLASVMLAPTLLWLLPESDHEAARLLLLAACATGAGIVAAVLAGPEPEAVLVRFYDRVRPPGSWGDIAYALGEPAAAPGQQLARGLAAVVLAVVSVFSLLTGFGSWLVGSPPPAGLSRPLFIGGLIGVGLLLVPLWWRLGMGQEARGRGGPQVQ